MSYQKEREFFLATFAREFPSASMDVARRLLREATGSQRANEILCSIDVGEREQARIEKREERRDARVAKLAESIGAKLKPGGDPRGFPYVLLLPSEATYDWGGQGLGIPGRGLPARCFQ